MVFGRKGLNPTPPSPPAEDPNPGHRAVLDLLRREEAEKPFQRAQLAGKILFDLGYRMIANNDRGARIEDLLGMLASCGGYACILAALDQLKREGRTPQEVGMLVVDTKDGQRFYFGDLPNRFLIESETALLSLALGAAHANGGAVTMEMVHDAMGHVAQTVGGSEFGEPRIEQNHLPSVPPMAFVMHAWPKLLDGLKLYEVPPHQRPAALGFALQMAIDNSAQVLDPTIAAKICIECAVPMAKLDPAGVPAG